MKQTYKNTEYTLQLVPADGPTLAKRTDTEWSLGYQFKVLASDLLSMRRGSYITIEDVHAAEDNYDLKFTIIFTTYNAFDKLRAESDNDINAQYILDDMVEVDQDGTEHFLLRGDT